MRFALPRYTILIRHHCVRTGQRPTPRRTSTLLSETPNVSKGNESAYRERMFYARRASHNYVHIEQKNNTVTVVPKMPQVVLCAQCHAYSYNSGYGLRGSI